MPDALQNLSRWSTSLRDSAAGARKSRKRAKNKSRRGDVQSQQHSEFLVNAARGVVTGVTFFLMGICFIFVNIAHFIAFELNRAGVWKLNNREEHMLMGRIMRGSVARIVVDWNPFWSLHFKNDVPMEKLPTPCIFMVNHLSFADPFFLCAAQRPLESKYLAASYLFKIPVVGRTGIASGDMAVHFLRDPKHGRWRTRDGNTDRILERSREYLRQGVPITVFPEGRVSRTEEMQQFKTGFFRLAIQEGVPIVPVALWGTQKAWPTNRDPNQPSNSLLLSAAEVEIHIGEPIDTEGVELRDLVIETYTKIQDMRNALPNFDMKDPVLAHMDPAKVYDRVPRSSLVVLGDAKGKSFEELAKEGHPDFRPHDSLNIDLPDDED